MEHTESAVRSAGAPQKLAEQAYTQLRRKLLSGVLEPGAPLRLERLKRDLGIGLTPLREALMRLSSEGLVEVEDIRGFRAAPATLRDMEDIMLSRAQIEAIALADAIARGDVDWEAEIVASFHRMSRYAASDPETGLVTDAWASAHRDFHRSLIEACESRWLKRFWLILFDQAQRYRHLSVTRGAAYRDDTAEHRQLMEAVLARDSEVALAASRGHIDSTCRILSRLLVTY
jgi:GntR family transcriptional regulator, carbon starvation induced regulator